MQRFAKFVDVTEDLFACLKGASGVPEVVPVSIDPGENAVVYDRRAKEWAYFCHVENYSVRLPEPFMGTRAEMQQLVHDLREPQLTTQARMLLAVLPYKPVRDSSPFRGSAALEQASAGPSHTRPGAMGDAGQHLGGQEGFFQGMSPADPGDRAQLWGSDVPPDVLPRPGPPEMPPDLLFRTRGSMVAALRGFMDEGRVTLEETGREPPAHILSSLDYAIQQQAEGVGSEVLTLHDPLFVWEKAVDRVIRPTLSMVCGEFASVESARPCHLLSEAVRQLQAAVPPPYLLQAQFDLVRARLSEFWDSVRALHVARVQTEAQRQSAQALIALAAASSSRSSVSGASAGYARPGLAPAAAAEGGQLSLSLRAKDEEFMGKPPAERGCRFWSGIEGSCRKPNCPDAATHVQGQPSAWYQARSKVWAAHGGIKNELGNWTLPKVAGVKRPVPGGGEGGGSTFQSP
jgi:hypothetical protein